jgi:hypothetical protein
VDYDQVRKTADLKSQEAAAAVRGIIAKMQKSQKAAELAVDGFLFLTRFLE